MVSPNTQPGGAADPSSAHTGHTPEEWSAGATAEDSSVVRTEGTRQVRRRIRYDILNAIISVGCRVDPERAARVRRVVPDVPSAIQGAGVAFAPRSMR